MALFKDKPRDISNKQRSFQTSSDSSSRRKKEWADNAKVIVESVSNAIIPGSGLLTGPIGGVIGGLLSEQDTGLTPEQQTRIDTQKAQRRERRDGGLYGEGTKEAEDIIEELPPVDDSSDESKASDIAKDVKKKKRTGTKQVLTSPLGATETAKTAVAKLGGY